MLLWSASVGDSRNTAPPPFWLSVRTRPLSASTMVREIDRPIPTPRKAKQKNLVGSNVISPVSPGFFWTSLKCSDDEFDTDLAVMALVKIAPGE